MDEQWRRKMISIGGANLRLTANIEFSRMTVPIKNLCIAYIYANTCNVNDLAFRVLTSQACHRTEGKLNLYQRIMGR